MAEINNFIKTIMEKDLKDGKVNQIVTRFPPEPDRTHSRCRSAPAPKDP